MPHFSAQSKLFAQTFKKENSSGLSDDSKEGEGFFIARPNTILIKPEKKVTKDFFYKPPKGSNVSNNAEE